MLQLIITLVGYLAVFTFGYAYSRRKLVKKAAVICEATKETLEEKSTSLDYKEFFYLCGMSDGVQILFGMKPDRPNLSKVLTDIHNRGAKRNA